VSEGATDVDALGVTAVSFLSLIFIFRRLSGWFRVRVGEMIIHVFVNVINYFMFLICFQAWSSYMVHKRLSNASGFARLSVFMLTSVFALLPISFLYASQSSGGTLTVITVPERAEVWIDGGYAGITPIRDRHLAAGTYTLRLVDPSRQTSASETVVISNGERLLVERTLGGNHAKLRVDTYPQGADVAIIAELGKTPLVNDYLTPGQYRLEIRHPNSKYMAATKDVAFVDGQPIVISHKLEKPPAFTTKRWVQLGLGTGAAAAWTWAVIEQHTASSSIQKSVSENAGTRRTVAIIAASALSVGLQVTIFVW